jgi:hypothetical protein
MLQIELTKIEDRKVRQCMFLNDISSKERAVKYIISAVEFTEGIESG